MEVATRTEDPFVVNIDEIPESGIFRETDLTLEWLESVLIPAYAAAEPAPHLTLRANKAGKNLFVSGQIQISVTYECSKCAKQVTKQYSFSVSGLFVPQEAHSIMVQKSDPYDDSFQEIYPYESHVFSVEQPFREAIIMDLSPYPLCKPDCKGLCPQCGADLNEGKCNCKPQIKPDSPWAVLKDLLEKSKISESSGGDSHGSTQKKVVKSKSKT